MTQLATPPNENHSLPNRHTGYLAASGYGKSQAAKQNPEIPKKNARLLLWDPGRDHKATRFTDRVSFLKAVSKAMRSGRGFRIAWSGVQDVATFEWFCTVVWQCLDGNKLLYVILEELAAVQPSSGKAPPVCGMLFNQSRKFGGIIHWTTQRGQEISKTVIDNTEIFYIGRPGRMSSPSQLDRLARVAGCPNGRADLLALEPLQFYHSTPKGSKLHKFRYKKHAA